MTAHKGAALFTRLQFFVEHCWNSRSSARSRRSSIIQGEAKQTFLSFGKPVSSRQVWIVASYDPETACCNVLARLLSRVHPAVVYAGNGQTLIVGGQRGRVRLATVEMFDCRRRLSRQLPPLFEAREGHGACVVGDTFVVCGGDGQHKRLKTCEVLFRNESKWRPLPNLKTARRGVAMVSLLDDRRVVVIGGRDDTGLVLSDVLVCKVPVDSAALSLRYPFLPFWSSLPSMREARCGHSAALFQGKIFVVGGWRSQGERLSSVEMFLSFFNVGQWLSLPEKMKAERFCFSLVVASNGFYTFGNFIAPCNSVERLKIVGGPNSKKGSTTYNLDDISASEWLTLPPVVPMKRIWGAVLFPHNLA